MLNFININEIKIILSVLVLQSYLHLPLIGSRLKISEEVVTPNRDVILTKLQKLDPKRRINFMLKVKWRRKTT